jgi:hypothetical protein
LELGICLEFGAWDLEFKSYYCLSSALHPTPSAGSSLLTFAFLLLPFFSYKKKPRPPEGAGQKSTMKKLADV